MTGPVVQQALPASSAPSLPWEPTARPAARRTRAQAYRAIREFFHTRDVLEVETPLLSRAANTDPQIDSFAAGDGGGPWYLRTSPEFALKRLLAAEAVSVFELGRVFRRAEQGRWHNPEFTMLEWYRPGLDDRALATEVVALIHAVQDALGAAPAPSRTLTTRQLFAQTPGGVDPTTDDREALDAFLAARLFEGAALERRDALELAIGLAVAEAAVPGELLVLFDFPAELAALARTDGPLARRFEVFGGALELANGYFELTDATVLAERMEADRLRRARLGRPTVPADGRLLAAHRHGLPSCAGVALGVDRLLAWVTGAGSIAEVLNFPADRA